MDEPSTVHSELARDESAGLIAASKVSGTRIYDRRGDGMGSVYDVMLDKRTGRIAYAVASIGGFLGMGAAYHPLPWNRLSYDTTLAGYRLDEPPERLRGAPTLAADYASHPGWEASDPSWSRRVDDYYGGGI